MKQLIIAFSSLILMLVTLSWKGSPTPANDNTNPEITQFLQNYNKQYENFLIASNAAEWELNTHIVEGNHDNANLAKEANAAFASFTGSKENILTAQEFLKKRDMLSPIEIKQLEFIIYTAGANPESARDIVEKKIAIEAQQTEKLFGFQYSLNGEKLSTNDIDKYLKESTNTNQRLQVWEASKAVGAELKDGVVELRSLRNASVAQLGYDDYFAYQVSDYGMKSDEMVTLMDSFISDIWPLYRELHTWARYKLAEKYNEPVPDFLPAHWLPNRWGQDWTAMVDVKGLNIDGFLKEKGPEYIVKQGEAFYVSLDSRPCLPLFMKNPAFILFQLMPDFRRITMPLPGIWMMIKM